MAIADTLLSPTTPVKPMMTPPTIQDSLFLSLPSDIIIPILSFVETPSALLITCRATHNIASDPYIRASWIISKLPASGDIPKGLVAFWIGVRHRIMNQRVMEVLGSMGVGCPLENELPKKEWNGWKMLAVALALRGNEEVVKMAGDMGLLRDMRMFVQTAAGCNNVEALGSAMDHLTLQDSSSSGDSDVESASSFSDSSDSETDSTSPRKPLAKPRAKSAVSYPGSTLSDPVLHHHILQHAISTNSPVLFHKACSRIPATSQAWSTISPYLFTNATAPVITTLAEFIKADCIPAPALVLAAKSVLTSSTALSNLNHLVQLGAVNFKGGEENIGRLLVRRLAMDGEAEVVEALVTMGCVADETALENAKLSGKRKCVKIVKEAMKL
ncbi:hypothetical protein HDV00_005686 [Rhizophlyctis rosea]|nr:hypothetical protein HDV00_005686 [Rhizophlyctis rosea]